MADTSTYLGIKNRYEELRRDYNFLVEAAYDDGSTTAQYAGPERLGKIVKSFDNLLEACSKLSDSKETRQLQADIIALLHSAEEDFADACLFECDPAADFEDYVSSRPCPIPEII